MNDVKLFNDGNPDVQVTEEEFVKTLEEVIKKGKEALESARKMPGYNKSNRYERSMRYWNVKDIMKERPKILDKTSRLPSAVRQVMTETLNRTAMFIIARRIEGREKEEAGV